MAANMFATSNSDKSVREEYFVDNVSDKLAISDCDKRVREEYLAHIEHSIQAE